MSSSLVALRHRNFRLLWGGLLLSFTGSFMQNAALLWHVSLLVPPERRGLALGFVGLAKIAPVVIFSMVAGVLADAWDRRKLMVVTQAGSALVAAALAALTFTGLTAVWPIYALAALAAAVGAFDMPARQALVPTLIPREHLPNAISLNSIMFQTASIAGPAAGGFVIAALGVGWAYIFNAISFGAVILAVYLMRDVHGRPADQGAAPEVTWSAALEGLRFVFQQPLMRSTMLLDFFATFFASATALLPIFAQDILAVGARGYGWLFAAPAIGAFVTSAAMVPLVERIERRLPPFGFDGRIDPACIAGMVGARTIRRTIGIATGRIDGGRPGAGIGIGLAHAGLDGAGEVQTFRHLGADGVVLVGRQGHSSQDAKDGQHHQQFGERPAASRGRG